MTGLKVTVVLIVDGKRYEKPGSIWTDFRKVLASSQFNA